MLSAAERARLETRLAERERATGVQMVIAVFPSLDGESLEDVSIRLAEKWKVGKKGVDNGVILVVFLKERKLRLEVGYGLEPVITDAVSGAIIRDALAPRFREQRYAAGLEAAADAVFARVAGGPAAARRGPAPWSRADPATVLLLALIGGVFGVAIFSAMRGSQRRAITAGGRGWSSHGPVFWGGGGGGSSGGGGAGGGFSGGGGDFGGGGASGDW